MVEASQGPPEGLTQTAVLCPGIRYSRGDIYRGEREMASRGMANRVTKSREPRANAWPRLADIGLGSGRSYIHSRMTRPWFSRIGRPSGVLVMRSRGMPSLV